MRILHPIDISPPVPDGNIYPDPIDFIDTEANPARKVEISDRQVARSGIPGQLVETGRQAGLWQVVSAFLPPTNNANTTSIGYFANSGGVPPAQQLMFQSDGICDTIIISCTGIYPFNTISPQEFMAFGIDQPANYQQVNNTFYMPGNAICLLAGSQLQIPVQPGRHRVYCSAMQASTTLAAAVSAIGNIVFANMRSL